MKCPNCPDGGDIALVVYGIIPPNRPWWFCDCCRKRVVPVPK